MYGKGKYILYNYIIIVCFIHYPLRSRADLEPFLAAGVGIKDHPQRYVSTGLAGNTIKPIRFSLEDMFQNDKELIGNAIKDGLDDVHWTRPLTVLILCECA